MAVRDRREGGRDGNPAAVGSRPGRKALLLVLAAVVAVGVAVGVAVFQPHKLFIDDKVDEALPTGVIPFGTGSGSAADAQPGASAPAGQQGARREGRFASRAHPTSGTAVILSMEDGSRLLRLENLKTDNGPDLRVYLSTAPASSPESAFDDGFIDLGALKGNIGSQNYVIPANVDVGRYQSAVVWCRRFSVAFGVAPLIL